MKPSDRHQFILAYLRRFPPVAHYHHTVNVLDRAFVEEYVDHTGVPFAVMPYGADKCPTLGRDLSDMHKKGLLTRHRDSINGLGGMGFPTWVWSYRIPAQAE